MRTILFNILMLMLFACSCSRGAASASSIDTSTVSSDSISSKKPTKATLYFVGDAMQHQAQLDQARSLGKGSCYDYRECFELIAPIVKKADYAIVNLEVPLGGGKGGYTGFPCFSAPDSFAEALKDAGFDLFLTANNHTLDRRDYGLRRTITVLDSLKVDHIGTYDNNTDRLQKVPFIKEINGIKVAFLNYTYGTNGISAREGAEVSLIDRDSMAREIAASRQNGAELVVVCVHWGEEYQLRENASQRNLAQFLLEQGTDMIIGGHPHVIQPMKIVDNPATGKKALIVYSLGNFISNMKTGDTRGGASVTCTIERDEQGIARFTDASYDTFYACKPTGNNDNFKVIPANMTDCIPASQISWWNTFDNAARRIFTQYNEGVSCTRHAE